MTLNLGEKGNAKNCFQLNFVLSREKQEDGNHAILISNVYVGNTYRFCDNANLNAIRRYK